MKTTSKELKDSYWKWVDDEGSGHILFDQWVEDNLGVDLGTYEKNLQYIDQKLIAHVVEKGKQRWGYGKT